MKDRVKELRRVRADKLKANPKNWRTHPAGQRNALRGIVEDVGFAGAVLARELEDGTLELVDGHLRAETLADEEIPVLVLDVTAEEADKLLATFDPIAAMAETDGGRLKELLADATFARPDMDELLAELAGAAERASNLVDSFVRPEATIPEAYQVVVECGSEDEQRAVFDEMRSAGRKCRVLTL